MQLTNALLLTLATAIAAAPMPWSEEVLGEIDALRARGMSEVCTAPSL